MPLAEIVVDLREHAAVRIAFGQRYPDFADCDSHLSADLQELQADRVALSRFQFRAPQTVLPQRDQQQIRHRRKVQPQLIGPHRFTAGAVGEQEQLLFLDAVLHVTAGAVHILVQALAHSRCSPQKMYSGR